MHKTNQYTVETSGRASHSLGGRACMSIFKRVMGAIASVALLLSLTMCETDYCNENMFVVGTLRVYFKQSKQQIGVILSTRNAVGDTLGYVSQTSGSYANFSLNPESDTSRFYIMTSDSIVLSKFAIVHTNRCEYVNAECGVRTLSTIDTVLIEDGVEGDSVSILMKDVDENYDNGNIEIFLAGFE